MERFGDILHLSTSGTLFPAPIQDFSSPHILSQGLVLMGDHQMNLTLYLLFWLELREWLNFPAL
jgi:hypothetical protein